jgi:hypothetical protein
MKLAIATSKGEKKSSNPMKQYGHTYNLPAATNFAIEKRNEEHKGGKKKLEI